MEQKELIKGLWVTDLPARGWGAGDGGGRGSRSRLMRPVEFHLGRCGGGDGGGVGEGGAPFPSSGAALPKGEVVHSSRARGLDPASAPGVYA